jgi:hypothetical protein
MVEGGKFSPPHPNTHTHSKEGKVLEIEMNQRANDLINYASVLKPHDLKQTNKKTAH